jgi:hypothetical protein
MLVMWQIWAYSTRLLNSGTNSLNMNIRNQNNIPAMVASSNNLVDDN